MESAMAAIKNNTLMKKIDMKSIKEIKCKCCGSADFIYTRLYQNIRSWKVLPNGKVSKKYTIQKDLPMEVENIICTNCGEMIPYWTIREDGSILVD